MPDLKRREALGAIAVVALLIFSLLYTYSSNRAVFEAQQLYFSIIAFVLVGLMLAFNEQSLAAARVDIPILAGAIVAMGIIFVMVNVIVMQPSLLKFATISSVVPTAGMVIHQVAFVGIGEGLLHFFLIRLSYVLTVTKKYPEGNWALAILSGSIILGTAHVFVVGLVWQTLTFLTLMFIVLAGLAMLPALMGSKKTRYALLISVVAHATYNILLISMNDAVIAPVATLVSMAGIALISFMGKGANYG